MHKLKVNSFKIPVILPVNLYDLKRVFEVKSPIHVVSRGLLTVIFVSRYVCFIIIELFYLTFTFCRDKINVVYSDISCLFLTTILNFILNGTWQKQTGYGRQRNKILRIMNNKNDMKLFFTYCFVETNNIFTI